MIRLTPKLLPLLVLLLAAGPLFAGIDARLLRYPDVSRTQIAFVYAGDVWVAPKSGGQAHRLSTPPGEESFPRFSPDGTQIAFSANYDGNTDIYVVPAAGGVPKRLTHHPMPDRMLDWYPEGKSILYATSMNSGKQRFNQFYRLSVDGGLPAKLPVPYGEFGSISSDGSTLAYMPVSRDFRTWKRYRGGSVTDVWLFDLEKMTSKNVTRSDTNDGQPMWHGSTLYFQSDRDGSQRSNIWAVDTQSGQTRQVTRFADYDVRFPAIGPDDIVFENGGRLYVMELDGEESREVEIEVVTDRATLKPRTEEVEDLIFNGDISPSGKRAVFEARGDLFSVPAEHGVVRNMTRSSGVAERYPAWSPDGKEIAYFSDRGGEYDLVVRPAVGPGDETTLVELGPGFRYNLFWSPDGRKLAFVDQSMTLRVYHRDREKLIDVDQDGWLFEGDLQAFRVDWSADSRWLAYAHSLESRLRALVLFDTEKLERHQVTSGFYDDSQPVFDPDGKYLYFLTGRTFRPSYSDLDNSWIYPNTTNVAAIPLREEVPSPLAARNDEEGAEEDGDEEAKSDDGKEAEKKKKKKSEKKDDGDEEEKPEPVEIDLDGFERRVVVLPPDPGNYTGLQAVSGKVLYRRQPRTGSGGEQSPIVYYDLEEREEKTILEDADGFAVSADDQKLLVVKDGKFGIVDVAEKQEIEKPLRTGEMTAAIDPMAEWKQLFRDVWRLERDFFYDPDLHGVDWEEMRRRYGSLIDDAVTRWDVDFLIGELIAELSASHTYRGGGDTERPERRGGGLLGADFVLENGAYRIARILDGAAWDSEVRSPLAEPGLEVGEGDYLLAVDGIPLDTSKDPWAALEGLGGKTVMLTVGDEPKMEGSREILVETLTSETRLRNLAWIESNRKRVEEASGGRLGYIYVPDTGVNGQNELVRQWRGQVAKQGLVIDERFNSGGQIPDRFVELLNRPLYNYWGVRDGTDWPWPPVAHTGPKVMLINQWSGSGGDALPFYFKKAGLGPLIGTRTWGGLIGISGAPRLIDGGVATVPTFGIYSTEGEWIIENYGVDPDIEVIDDPALMVDGGDPQLDRAIEEALRLLQANPRQAPGKPDYPVK